MVKKKFPYINLIPPSHRPSLIPLNPDQALLAGLVLTCILSGVMLYKAFTEKHTLEARIKDVQAQVASYNKQIDELKGRITLQAAMSEKQQLIQQLVAQRQPWAEIFKELSIVIPSHTWLTDFSAQNQNGRLEYMMRGQTGSQANMADFYSALEKSVHFNKLLVRYSKSAPTTPPSYGFEFATSPAAPQNVAATPAKEGGK